MIRLSGIVKVLSVFAIDFFAVYGLTRNTIIAAMVVACIGIYTFFGGYLTIFKEGGVRSSKLPVFERKKLEDAKNQLVVDVKRVSSVNINHLKIYLIPNDSEMQATAYGCNCISVSKGMVNSTDPITLTATMGHEVSHILHLDPEFSRQIFASVVLICMGVSAVSLCVTALVLLIFLVFNFLRSWMGFMVYRGASKIIKWVFGVLQKGLVVIYQMIMSCVSRSAEYRCDRYSASLNPSYGLQLANFLRFADLESNRQHTLTEAMYRTHPATTKRIAALEVYISKQVNNNSKKYNNKGSVLPI